MNITFTFISSLISLAMLVFLIFWLYRDLCTDRFRQEMFELRDDLFMEAAKDHLEFDMVSYALLRNAINGFIRFGHRLNLAHLLLLALIGNRKKGLNGITFSKRFEASLQDLPETQKKLLLSYYMRMNFVLLTHMVLSAPVLIITLFLPIATAKIAKTHVMGIMSKIINKLQLPFDRLDTAALATGECK